MACRPFLMVSFGVVLGKRMKFLCGLPGQLQQKLGVSKLRMEIESEEWRRAFTFSHPLYFLRTSSQMSPGLGWGDEEKSSQACTPALSLREMTLVV